MERRQFLAASLATAAAALVGNTAAAHEPASKREFYQIRRYSLKTGSHSKLTEDYFAGGLLHTRIEPKPA